MKAILPQQKPPKDPRTNAWYSHWEYKAATLDYSEYDAVVLSFEEFCSIQDRLGDIPTPIGTFEHPALREFVVKLRTEELTIMMYYCPTIWEPRRLSSGPQIGSNTNAWTSFDCYASTSNSDGVLAVITISYAVSMTARDEGVRTFSVINLSEEMPTESEQMLQDLAGSMFVAAQRGLLECPEIYREASTGSPIHTNKPGEKTGKTIKRGKAKMIRVIQVNRKTLDEQNKSKHQYTKECWTVRGHDRHYKNGDVKRIETYLKGFRRHDPKALCPKDYETGKIDDMH